MSEITNTVNDTTLVELLSTAHDSDQNAIQAGELVLPIPSEMAKSLPIQLSDAGREQIESSREKIRNIIDGKDSSRLLIVGPCSPDFRGLSEGKIPAVLAYARQLKQTIDDLEKEHKVIVVLRTPAVKPRTSVGWGGIFPDSPTATRILFTAMANEGIRLATEVYGQLQQDYLSDLCVITWVGARNVSAPNTRAQVAESTNPVLVKHGLTDVVSSIHARSVIAAQQPASHIDWERGRLVVRKTRGNPHTLTILRGFEIHGKHEPNIDTETILETCHHAEEAKLPCGVVIDISHSNGNKTVEGSLKAFDKVIALMNNKEVSPHIRGIMVESYLGGKGDAYGESMTDPTIDIETTKKLMKQFAELCE